MLAAELLDDNYCYTVLNVQRVYGVWTLIVNFERQNSSCWNETKWYNVHTHKRT